MKSSPRSTKDDFKQSRFSTQADFSNALSSNHALVTVAQEVAERLQQAYPLPSDDSNSVEAILIRAVDSDLRQMILAESLTDRELEVLQLIVDGDNSIAIARKLNISVGTAKTHIRGILKKLIFLKSEQGFNLIHDFMTIRSMFKGSCF